MKRFASVGLDLDSRPESVALVRAALSGVAEWCELEPEVVNDLKTVVSEACNNVVVHAYEGDAGPMSVTIVADGNGVGATVRDLGAGFHAIGARDDGMGVGLAVISALAARAEFASPADGGTEVRVWLPRPSGERNEEQAEAPPHADQRPGHVSSRDALPPAVALAGDVCVTVSPVSVTTPVLGRLTRAVAATARFSFDRFSDVYLVADAVGAHAQRAAAGDCISFSVASSAKRIELAVGPFGAGSCAALRPREDSEPNDSPLWLLADDVSVDEDEEADTVRLVLLDRGVH